MTNKVLAEKLKTINGITITPFKEGTREIDWQGVEENVEYLIAKGIKVIVPCGNTSEFYALTLEEAKEEIKRTVEWTSDSRSGRRLFGRHGCGSR